MYESVIIYYNNVSNTKSIVKLERMMIYKLKKTICTMKANALKKIRLSEEALSYDSISNFINGVYSRDIITDVLYVNNIRFTEWRNGKSSKIWFCMESDKTPFVEVSFNGTGITQYQGSTEKFRDNVKLADSRNIHIHEGESALTKDDAGFSIIDSMFNI